MHDYQQYRRSAVRYWEIRRIIYNVLLAPPAFLGYCLADGLNYMGAPHSTDFTFVIPMLALSALGANICYSFAYALEFLRGSDNPISAWQQRGRTIAFVMGVLFAMLLAFLGGKNIADLEFYQHLRRH